VVTEQAERAPEDPPAVEARREEPAAAARHPPVRRPLKKRVAILHRTITVMKADAPWGVEPFVLVPHLDGRSNLWMGAVGQ
jgi:hypothetical protein